VTWSRDVDVAVLQKLDDVSESVHESAVSPVTQLLQSPTHHGLGKTVV